MKKSSEVEVKIGFSVTELVAALRELSDEDREFFIENLLAARRALLLPNDIAPLPDYRQGKTVPYEELFKG